MPVQALDKHTQREKRGENAERKYGENGEKSGRNRGENGESEGRAARGIAVFLGAKNFRNFSHPPNDFRSLSHRLSPSLSHRQVVYLALSLFVLFICINKCLAWHFDIQRRHFHNNSSFIVRKYALFSILYILVF